jgi:hypothetical protein
MEDLIPGKTAQRFELRGVLWRNSAVAHKGICGAPSPTENTDYR